MRPAKLYLEIFISFVMVMIASEVLIFFLFTDSERRIVGDKLGENTVIKVAMLKELIEEKIGETKASSPSDISTLEPFLKRMEELYKAQIWIADAAGDPLLKPSSKKIPADIGLLDSTDRTKNYGDIRIYNHMRQTQQVFASVPLALRDGEKFSLFVVFETGFPATHRWRFVLGLAVIGVVVAFLIIPVSRFITDRVKDLKVSALRIAEGELSHRVSVKMKDEIGELGLAFNQMADRLERMILGGKELTANISHELRTPLTRMRVAEELLTEQFARGDFKHYGKYMKTIREDIEELNILIGRILELSKLDILESPMKSELFNPAEFLEDLLERFKPVIVRKDLVLSKNLPPDVSAVGDQATLYTAFLNIFDNAMKYTPEKGTLAIALTSRDGSCIISITNSFEPLSERDLERIFEPFYRSKQSTAPGSGLGLSIAGKIIQKNKGEIRACNAPEGLEIRVCLPNRTGSSASRG